MVYKVVPKVLFIQHHEVVIPISEAIIQTIIMSLVTLFGTFGGILTANKLSNYRIEQLEKKVDRHNTIKSNINRNLNMGATSVDISDITIGGDAYIMADEIIMNERTVITGKLSYGEDSNVIGLNEATIGSKELVKNVDIDITYTLKDKAIDFLFSLVGAYLVMLVLFMGYMLFVK